MSFTEAMKSLNRFSPKSHSFLSGLTSEFSRMDKIECIIREYMEDYPDQRSLIYDCFKFGTDLMWDFRLRNNDYLWESHVREMIERVIDGTTDLDEPTLAEILCVYSEVSLYTPLKGIKFETYCWLYHQVLPDQAKQLNLPNVLDGDTYVSRYKMAEAQSHINPIRKKLTKKRKSKPKYHRHRPDPNRVITHMESYFDDTDSHEGDTDINTDTGNTDAAKVKLGAKTKLKDRNNLEINTGDTVVTASGKIGKVKRLHSRRIPASLRLDCGTVVYPEDVEIVESLTHGIDNRHLYEDKSYNPINDINKENLSELVSALNKFTQASIEQA